MTQVPGLEIYENWITEEKEIQLLKDIDASTWSTTLKRRTQQYGHEYNYKNRSVYRTNLLGYLPNFFEQVIARLLEEGKIETKPEQCIVNEYEPGQGIAKHTDSVVFAEPIISISLSSSCNIIYKRKEKVVPIYLKRRSLLIMRGKARWKWTHEIPSRKSDDGVKRERRVSVTFRWMS